jgi:hypothetical protein
MYKIDLLSIIRTNRNPPPTPYTNIIHSQAQVPEAEGRYKAVAASLWPIAAIADAELLYICMKKTCYEYEGNGGSQ